eukprot:1767905-Amphidinium_carterae.1
MVEISHVDDESLLRALAQPTLHALVQYHRLSFLRRVVMADNPLVRAASTVTCKGSMWPLWIADLRLLQERGLFLELPAPSFETVGQWIQHIILLQSSWKGILKDNLLPRQKPSASAVRMLSQPRGDGDARVGEQLVELAEPETGVELHPEQGHHFVEPAEEVYSCHICD